MKCILFRLVVTQPNAPPWLFPRSLECWSGATVAGGRGLASWPQWPY